MISFPIDGHRFHLRAAAVVFRDDELLVHRLAGDPIWALPGGRVDGGETGQEAVVRELREELGQHSTAGELLVLSENFFGHGQERHHEIGLYYRVTLAAGSPALEATGSFEGREGEQRLEFLWVPRRELHTLDLRPTALIELLAQPEPRFTHLVSREPIEASS